MRSTENLLHPVASSSSIASAFSSLAPGIDFIPSWNREEASNSSVINRGDLYAGPSNRNSMRSTARSARRSTNLAKSCGVSPTVSSRHCWRSSDTLAGSPATMRARDGSLRRMARCSISGGR